MGAWLRSPHNLGEFRSQLRYSNSIIHLRLVIQVWEDNLEYISVIFWLFINYAFYIYICKNAWSPILRNREDIWFGIMVISASSAASVRPQGSYLNLLSPQEHESTLSQSKSSLHFPDCARESKDPGAIGGTKILIKKSIGLEIK